MRSVIIVSDNGLPPVKHQAIIWTCVDYSWIVTYGTNFSEIWIKLLYFSFKNFHLKMPSVKCRLQNVCHFVQVSFWWVVYSKLCQCFIWGCECWRPTQADISFPLVCKWKRKFDRCVLVKSSTGIKCPKLGIESLTLVIHNLFLWYIMISGHFLSFKTCWNLSQISLTAIKI